MERYGKTFKKTSKKTANPRAIKKATGKKAEVFAKKVARSPLKKKR